MWPWPRTLALPMCAASRTIPLTRRCKVTVACFAVTVVGLGVTDTIVTLIAGLGGADAAWPVTGKTLVAASMVAVATEVTRRFILVNSLLIGGIPGDLHSVRAGFSVGGAREG